MNNINTIARYNFFNVPRTTAPFVELMITLAIMILAALSFPANAANDSGKVPEGIIILKSQPAPPLSLEDIDGNHYTLAEKPGKWVFVHFWASWCGPCRREMPTIQSMSKLLEKEIEEGKIQIILINTSETEDTVFSFLSIAAPDFSPLMDRDGQVTERWQPRGLPATYFVSPEGKLEYIALGGRTWDKPVFLNFVRGLLKK